MYRFLFPLLLLLASSKLVFAQSYQELLSQSQFTTHNGQSLNFKAVIGNKPIYIKFWASWCVPCNQQMPHFQQAYQTLGRDIQFLSVNLDLNDNEDSVADIIKKYNLTVPTISDSSGKLAKAFELEGTPLHVLLDKDGKLVHKGHDADEKLDLRLALLASKEPKDFPEIRLQQHGKDFISHKIASEGTSVLYFSSSWCDWYLKDSRPEQSQNCIQGQQLFNQWYQQHPEIYSLGVLSRLWTTEKELSEYQDKYKVQHQLAIDKSNNAFIAYGIRQLPTLILIKDGKEVARVTEFKGLATLEQELQTKL